MTAKPRRPSPTLSAVVSAIDSAATPLVTSDSGFSHSFEVDIDQIRTVEQPRTLFDPEAIDSLARSLHEHGQLQPIILRRDPERRGGWVLVAGERRLRAARSLGWTRLLALETASSPEAIALVENLQRADLTPLEEARGIQRMITHLGLSQREAARLLGKHESDISRIQRVLTLPRSFLEAVETSGTRLERELLVELARHPEGALRDRLLAQALQGKLTVRAVREARETETVQRRQRIQRADPVAAARAARGLAARIRLLADQGTPLNEREVRSLEGLRDELERVLDRVRSGHASSTSPAGETSTVGGTQTGGQQE
jgi:ParB family chromosome partitioning protein